MQSEHRWYLFQDEQGKYAITTHARAGRFNLDPICSEDYSLFFTRRGALLGGVPVIIKRPCLMPHHVEVELLGEYHIYSGGEGILVHVDRLVLRNG
jgi:hypothetical protein